MTTRFILLIIISGVFSATANSQDLKRNTGFFNLTEFTYITPKNAVFDRHIQGQGMTHTDLSVEDARAYSLQTIGGYFISPLFSVGAGFGLDGYHEPDINTAPLFLDARFYFRNARNTPLLYINYGTLLKLGEEFEKGTTVEAGAGYKFFATDKLALQANIHFNAKGVSLTDDSYTTSDRTITVRGIGFSLGVMF